MAGTPLSLLSQRPCGDASELGAALCLPHFCTALILNAHDLGIHAACDLPAESAIL